MNDNSVDEYSHLQTGPGHNDDFDLREITRSRTKSRDLFPLLREHAKRGDYRIDRGTLRILCDHRSGCG